MSKENSKKGFLDAVNKNYPEELHRFLRDHWMDEIPKRSSSFIPLSLLFEQSFFKSEALKVYPQAVNHRDSSLSKGWKSICLHGLSSEKTQSYRTYGYPTQDERIVLNGLNGLRMTNRKRPADLESRRSFFWVRPH